MRSSSNLSKLQFGYFLYFAKKEDSGLESRRTANVTSKEEGAEKQRAYIFQDNFLLWCSSSSTLLKIPGRANNRLNLVELQPKREILNINVNLVSLVDMRKGGHKFIKCEWTH